MFDRVSFDLIYARQRQSHAEWRDELSRALAMSTGHLSLYQLTIEDGTAFGDRLRCGRLRGLPSEELSADLYEITQEMCEAAGLPAYEISNHAAPDARCRHNLIYWRGGDFAGIGPGAHGRLTIGQTRFATEAHRVPGKWLSAVEGRSCGDLPRVALEPGEAADEYLLSALRLDEGLSMARHRRLGGSLPPARLQELLDDGFVEMKGDTLRATRKGRPLLNAVLGRLV